ncbi:MAG: DUF4202 domain-containing protein [Aestuariivirga sp.]|uniref:DUF4202 domain-containing protein n=1 Tax=Aestuariivirga sp. TaxID=2650926 RepID=UPI0025BFDB15|nr:DUF4202 domain-containing protein [Aestuariivirga sp.]MCA3560474.1 DUF4202 domain-containing protein [Aestuariivirga sp.]
MPDQAPDRLTRAYALIDAANARDPASQAELYGRRMTETLESFRPDAPETLKIAARAQHIERWTIPRASYPEGRIAYLTWRKDLQKLHARRAAEIMAECGYAEDEIARTGALLRKERLKQDADAQTLEDVICLVFLAHEAEAFIARHDDGKVRDILAKTAKKMSAVGLAAAGSVPMGDRLRRLLGEALTQG